MTTQLGRYDLIDRIASGGMAEVWKARVRGPIGFEKVVALKRIHPHLLDRDEYLEMFAAEAKLAAQLVHPNIVQVFDFGISDGAIAPECFLAMELVQGTTLSRLWHAPPRGRRRFPTQVVAYVGVEVARGLEYAHTAHDDGGDPLQIVHRDVSPQNILVSGRGEVKVADFGIAKFATAMSRTHTGIVKGKLGYMSPEQILQQPLDRRTDIFALGIVLYELASGRLLFDTRNMVELYQSVKTFQGLSDAHLTGVAPELHMPLRSMLQPDPAYRCARAADIETELSAVLGGDGPQARRELAARVQETLKEPRPVSPRPVTGTTRVDPASPGPPPMALEGETETVRPVRRGVLHAVTQTRLRWVALAALLGLVGIGVVLVYRWTRPAATPGRSGRTVLALAPQSTATVAALPTPVANGRTEAKYAPGPQTTIGMAGDSNDAPPTSVDGMSAPLAEAAHPTPPRNKKGKTALHPSTDARKDVLPTRATTFRIALVDRDTKTRVPDARVTWCGREETSDAHGEIEARFVLDRTSRLSGCELAVYMGQTRVLTQTIHPSPGQTLVLRLEIEPGVNPDRTP